MEQSPPQILRRIYEARQSRNPRYSMRALARDLAISQTMLVQVMSGKRGLSAEMAIKIANRLQLPETEAIALLDAVVFETLKTPESRAFFQAIRRQGLRAD